MTPTLEILQGVPASGKSTYAMGLVKDRNYVRVNRDEIRFTLFGSYWGKKVNEDVVTRVENAAIEGALAAGRNVVLDATNLRRKFLTPKLSIANLYDAEVIFKQFPISLDEAVRRDAARDRTVGADVIARMFKDYRLDTEGRGMPKPPEPLPSFEPYVPDTSKPDAYIVDTDGTVANHEPHRSPYDTDKYHLDTLIKHVAYVADAIAEYGISVVGLSGRDESFREVTEKWWSDNHITYSEFYMRPKGDTRMDAIVKYDLFKTHIEPNYNVLGAFDDRPQVLRMWRKIGVPVFNVGAGEEF